LRKDILFPSSIAVAVSRRTHSMEAVLDGWQSGT
jgi:hypothetical protein